jgi:hypothetical protein
MHSPGQHFNIQRSTVALDKYNLSTYQFSSHHRSSGPRRLLDSEAFLTYCYSHNFVSNTDRTVLILYICDHSMTLKQLRFTVNCLPLGHHQPAQPPLRGSRMVASRYVLCPLYSYWRLLLSIISVSLVQRRRIQYIHCFLRQLRDRHGLYLTFGLRRVIRAYLIWPSCRRGGYHIGNSVRHSLFTSCVFSRAESCSTTSFSLGIDVEPLFMFPPFLACSTVLAPKALIQTTCPLSSLSALCAILYSDSRPSLSLSNRET